MLEEYIYCGTKKLRCGITTGTCAAAAAKAAAAMLITNEDVLTVNIMTPKGIEISADILCIEKSNEYVSCAVRKDSGDDPDITNGMLVFAKVRFISNGIEIKGGKGIGKVTKPGLDQPVGAYAINSVPRKMIAEAVADVAETYGKKCGFEVVISVPDGEKAAKKTFNPRLGIENGISIIGTSGIVEPMSSSALIETIRREENVRRAEGYENLLLTIGNYSNSFIEREMPFAMNKSVLCSNFIGEAIDHAIGLGFKSVLIVGHMGKLVKLGAGIMNTHSSYADGRMDVLVTCGVLAGADISYLRRLPDCVTVDAAIDILNESGNADAVFDILSRRAEEHLAARVRNCIEIGAVMFSDRHSIKIETPSAGQLIKRIAEEYNG